MRIAVLGTGMVGKAVATKLAELGHDVAMGSRSADNAEAAAWAGAAPGRAAHGTFATVAKGSDLLINATSGEGSVEAIGTIDEADLEGAVLIDIANPLSHGPSGPELFVSNTDSLAETIQRGFPTLRVVKALNTMTADLMVNPASLPAMTNAFVAGDDQAAKQLARELLTSFGWHEEDIVDVGPLRAARGLEAYVLFWVTLMQALGTPAFNVRVVK